MAETLIELPFAGRRFAAPASQGMGSTPMAMPSFVAGPENGLAAFVAGEVLDVCRAYDALEGGMPARPVVIAIHGASGVGKTHLLSGLVEAWQATHGADTARYVAAGDFRRELVNALDHDRVAEFRRCARGCQLLAVDELDQLPRDAYLQEEFRYMLDDRAANGLLTLVAMERSVACLANLSPDIRSRLAAGLELQLAAPSLVARARLLEQAGHALGCTLPRDAARQIAADARNARDVVGSLFELLATAGAAANLDGDAVRLHIARRAARRTPLREIVAVVARYHGLPQKTIKSGSRKQSVVAARAMVVYLARRLSGASYEQIGQALGGRDHTTIMHSFRTIDRERKRDWQLQESLDDLQRVLLSA